MSPLTELRVLMVGPTGAGKSSTANTILMAAEGQDKKLFRIGETTDSVTRWNEEYTRNVLGRKVTVVDTPGADNAQDDPVEILKEIRAAIEYSDKPYDAILYVVSVFGNKLHLDDLTLRVFKLAENIISKDFWNHCVLVFTHGDSFIQLQREKNGVQYENVPFDEFIRRDKTSRNTHAIGRHVQLVDDAAVLIDNKTDRSSSLKTDMVEQILQKVEFVKNKNGNVGFGKDNLRTDPQYPQPTVVPIYRQFYNVLASCALYVRAYGWQIFVALLIIVIACLLQFK